jgi:tetratricopeptide (TPR) repeat protein
MPNLRPLWRLGLHARLWWRGRSKRLLLLGLPALLTASGLVIVTGLCLLAPAGELEARYLEAGKDALNRKDYAAARTCYRRLASRGAGRPEVVYGQALTAEALGEAGRAESLMADLAPEDRPEDEDRPGYAPAHLWQARRLLRTAGSDPQARASAEKHLLHALDGDLAEREAAHGLLGELYLATGRLDRAEPHLARAVKTRPQLRMRLALLHAMRGDRSRAASEANLALTFFRARAMGDLQDHFARVQWADALTFLEQFPEAVAVLEEGWNATREPLYRAVLAGAYLTWADAVARDPKAKVGERLRLVERGLTYDPASPALLDRLLAATRTDGAGADEARAVLRNMAATGVAAGTAHFALGLDAWQRGREEEARLHWERAIQLAPQVVSVANNLAWLLAQSKQPDLPRALELSNRAVASAPANPSFRDTRGRILARMGRYKEALPDLDAAVAAAPHDADLHRTLADVYRRLGSPGMADEHERLAGEKAATAPPPPARP